MTLKRKHYRASWVLKIDAGLVPSPTTSLKGTNKIFHLIESIYMEVVKTNIGKEVRISKAC